MRHCNNERGGLKSLHICINSQRIKKIKMFIMLDKLNSSN